MLIDRIYQKVKTYVNTEGRGNVTPAKFNLMLHDAIQKRNEDYFFQTNRQTNRDNRGLIENGIPNTPERFREKVNHYLKETYINQVGGYYPLPSDYRYIDEIEVIKSYETEDIYQDYEEWVGTTAGDITVDFEDTDNPYSGNRAIKVTNAEEASQIIMTRSATFNPLNFQTVSFRVNLTNVPILGDFKNSIFLLYFKTASNQNVMPGISVNLNTNLVGEYQLVVVDIPTDTVVTTSLTNQATKIVLEVRTGVDISELFIDDWKLQGKALTFASLDPTKDKREFNIIKTQVVEDFPIYLKVANNLIVEPNTQEQLKITYLRKPLFPKWTYTVVSNVEVFNPSANDFVDADIHPSEEDEMVKRVLFGFGINLKDGELQQAVGNENATEFNQQNAN